MMGELIDDKSRSALLGIARESLRAFLAGGQPKPAGACSGGDQPMGCFVTLRNRGELRGCVGRFESDGIPLSEWVSRMVVEAAAHDPRFASIRVDELDQITIQISAVSEPQRIDHPEAVVIGRDGLQVRGWKNGAQRSGTLLPQVATERGWSVNTFWSATCEKAGLDRDAWRHADTELFTFTAECFGDDEEST